MTARLDAPPRPAATRTVRPTRDRAPWRPHLATLASVLAVTTSSWAINPLLAPGRWAQLAFGVCLVLAWGTAWLRTRVRNPFLPTLLGLLVLAYGLSVAYLSRPGEVTLLPDGGTLDRLGLLAAATVENIVTGVAPLEVTPGLEAAAIAGIGAVYLLVELFCFGLRTPAWSGVPLLALWLPATAIYVTVSGWVFALAAVAFLGLVAIASEPPAGGADERRRRLEILAVWATVLAVVTLALAPLAARVPGWGSAPLPQVGSGGPGAVLLGSDLNMSDSLGQQSAEVALRYRFDPASVGPLRLRTMHEFDGETWRLDESPGSPGTSPADDELLWPGPVAPALLEGTSSRLEVEIVNLREDRLPIPVAPRSLSGAGTWTYDAVRDEVRRGSPTTPGESYAVTTTTGSLTPELLRGLSHGEPEQVEAYLEVPATPHATDVQRRAREVTADAGNAYDQALLLQTYLRSPPFDYQTAVPLAVTGDAVWDFLESGQGYCVQFATAMTIMARHLGIPARMAVGFLPGTAAPGDPRVHEVRGDRAHTWPELHFEGVGWVRFEPTPAAQSGLPPRYADPFAATGEDPAVEPELPVPTAVPTPLPTPSGGVGAPAGTGGLGDTVRESPWLVALGAGVVALLVAAAFLVVRRLRRTPPPLDPEAAWALLRARLARLAVTWPDSATPRQAAASVARQVGRRRGRPLDDDAAAALDLLAGSLEAARYAPRPGEVAPEDLASAVADVVGAVTPAESSVGAGLPGGRPKRARR